MDNIIPEKLKKGDEVRIIAPSTSMNLLSEETISIAKKRLEDMGLVVSFGKNVNKIIDDNYNCASIKDRIDDLHDAFRDEKVKCILTVIGGFNVNQLLDYIDYDLIKSNPKIICGYSDITALLNAIYTKTGLITYHGPFFSTFGMKKGFEYIEKYFKELFFEEKDVEIESSNEWSEDSWYKDQDNRSFVKNEGIKVVHEGIASGKIIGGNLCTLNLLQGTEYMPNLDNTILFIEDDDLAGDDYFKEFDRDLQSLLHSSKEKKINGIVIGRAQSSTNMNYDMWKTMIETKEELKNIPVIVNADFGHTYPMFTFPIGLNAKINNGKLIIKRIE